MINNILSFLFTKTPLYFLTQSFWRDEAFSVILAKKPVLEIIHLSAKDFTPPLYYLLIKVWIFIFGDSEVAVRTLSLIFYALSIYIFILILENLFKEKKNLPLIFLSTLSFASLPIVVYYAFEARMYEMFLFFTLLFYYGILKNNENIWKVSALLGFFTHYFFLFNLISAYLIFSKKQRKKLLKISILPLLWLAVVSYFKITSPSNFWIQKLKLKDILYIPFYLTAGYDRNWEPLYKKAIFISIFIYFAFLASFVKSSFKKHHKHLLAFWLIIPILTTTLSSFTFLPIFLPRYLIFTTPALILILASLKNKNLALLFLFLLIGFNFTYNQYLVKHKRKIDYKKELSLIKKLADDNTLIYISSPEEYPVFVYYLGEKKVFIYNKVYENIPAYIGKVIIPKEKIVNTIPFFPKKALVFDTTQKPFLVSIK